MSLYVTLPAHEDDTPYFDNCLMWHRRTNFCFTYRQFDDKPATKNISQCSNYVSAMYEL